jgi:predicted outer membrane protein
VRIARVPALLLLVAVGVLGALQPANAATPQPDVAYLNAAHQINLTIIESAHAATTKGKTACVRRAAAQLERDHSKLSAQELDVATRLNILLPTEPSATQRQQLNAVAAKAGTAGYDAAWLALQRQEHQQYLALVNGELPISASPAVESLAEGAKPVLQMHQRLVAGTCKTTSVTPVVPTGDGGQHADAEKARARAAVILLGIGAVLLFIGKSISVRRRLAGVIALGAGLVMLFGGQPANTGKVPAAGKTAAEREAAVPPVRLKLPGVLEASVRPVGTGADGQLQVPKSSADVGWWAAGAAPGADGGTVLLAGHVDTTRGRGVFAALSEVPVGATVGVTSGDGEEHWYRIVARRTYKQEALPADLFQGAAKPRLALVTCTGSYDRAAHRYSQNLVLYGVPVD